MPDLECVLCGGKDFYKEAGYFYCNECQTQTQELREHVLDEELHIKATVKKVKSAPKESKQEETLTSWECYNYILLGLVNELIELGADKSLKRVVKTLWIKYLTQLGVVSENASHLPKLQAFNSKRDAHVMYGVSLKKKRKRRKSSSRDSSTSASTNVSMRKRAVIKAEQEEETQSQVPLADRTLTDFSKNLQLTASTMNMPVQYNRYASKELKKHMCSKHLDVHRKDKLNTSTCHKITHSAVSQEYKASATILTRKRIFSILYLGLLLIKDKIQLGDLIRFVNEGHLSFHEYLHFFPESLGQKKLNLCSYNNNLDIPNHSGFRDMAWKVCKLLKIKAHLPVQNLVELSERYCRELNLPDEMHQCVVSLMAEAVPHAGSWTRMPNFEGRAVSYIIFVLKLLFGLDGESEDRLSDFADAVNEHLTPDSRKMFNFNDWLTCLQTRKLALSETSFTENEKTERFKNSSLFVNFIREHNSKYDVACSSAFDYSLLQDSLRKLAEVQRKEVPISSSKFPATLTPYATYTEALLKSKALHENTVKVLRRNFRLDSLEFLLRSERYFSYDFDIRHSGANDLLEFIDTTLPYEKPWLSNNVNVDLTDDDVQLLQRKKTSFPATKRVCAKKRLQQYHANNGNLFQTSRTKYAIKKSKLKVGSSYRTHFHPHERFWLRSHDVRVEEQFRKIFSELPFALQVVLGEAARITEQSCWDVWEECSIVEQYFCYKKGKSAPVMDEALKKLVESNVKHY